MEPTSWTSLTALNELIQNTSGPILIVGANGFIGWNFFRTLSEKRDDVIGLARSKNWRTQSMVGGSSNSAAHLYFESAGDSFEAVMQKHHPSVIFDLACFGAYPSQQESERVFETNFQRVAQNLDLVEKSERRPIYILAGSSSEYGFECDRPTEDQASPNSLYAVSKGAAAQLIQYYGKMKDLPCLDLRLFSIYGPYETPSRLIPRLALAGSEGRWPGLSKAQNARDFVHVEDVLRAFLTAAQKLNQLPSLSGQIFNIGTGVQSSLKEVCELTQKIFNQNQAPEFGTITERSWDQTVWVANTDKATAILGWKAEISFEKGFRDTMNWWKQNADLVEGSTLATEGLLSIIVAVHRDEESLEPLYEAVRLACEKAHIDFELIFVNDRSPDGAAEKIRTLSSKDRRVVGLSHAKNSGSQVAFWTGLKYAKGDACILMDGDLQDPPDIIPQLVDQWRRGSMIVLAKRQGRSMNPLLHLGHKLFYRLARRFSGAPLAVDVGDFSLMDRQAVQTLLENQGQELWIRGLRALIGFETTTVDYHRPERPFGQSTNSVRGLFGWAYRGLFLFSGEPLRRWNRFLFFGVLPAGLASFLYFGNGGVPELTTLIFQLLVLASLGMIGEILVAIYRQVLGRPQGQIEHIIQFGKIQKWK